MFTSQVWIQSHLRVEFEKMNKTSASRSCWDQSFLYFRKETQTAKYALYIYNIHIHKVPTHPECILLAQDSVSIEERMVIQFPAEVRAPSNFWKKCTHFFFFFFLISSFWSPVEVRAPSNFLNKCKLFSLFLLLISSFRSPAEVKAPSNFLKKCKHFSFLFFLTNFQLLTSCWSQRS